MIEQLKKSPIIPVLTLDDVNKGLEITDILTKYNFNNIEITLRTNNSLKCLDAIASKFPEANIGAGTITQSRQLTEVKNAGACFAVSPGFTRELVDAAKKAAIFYLPGASTPSEIIALKELSFTLQKFFHATNSGGVKMLKAYSLVFPDIMFCPTGGITQDNFSEYLKLKNVLCLGGSWLVQQNMSPEDIYKSLTKAKKELI